MEDLLLLRDVIQNIKRFKWSDALFLPKNTVWNLNSSCAVLDPDDVENDEDEAPQYAVDHGLEYVLGVQDVQGIIDNLTQQGSSNTDEEVFAAFLYYCENDAFIVLDSK